MRKIALVFVLTLLLPFITTTANAGTSPCEVVLCMSSYGDGGSACRAAEKRFFKIIKFKRGKLSRSRTYNARRSFLNQCVGADPKVVNDIIRSFGTKFF